MLDPHPLYDQVRAELEAEERGYRTRKPIPIYPRDPELLNPDGTDLPDMWTLILGCCTFVAILLTVVWLVTS